MGMYYYAQLNENNVCIGIASSSNRLNQNNMIPLFFDDQDKVYRKYDFNTSSWSTEKYPEGYAKTPLEYYNEKLQYLNEERDKEIYGTFEFEGNVYDCDKFALENMDKFEFKSNNDPTFAGMFWRTSGGNDLIFLTSDKMTPMKLAMIEVTGEAFAEFNRLETALRAIDLESATAIDEIQQITWRQD